MSRFGKQLIYGVGYLVFFGVLGWGIYLGAFQAPPSCFDGKRNGAEEGIDCGGSCAHICLSGSFRPLRVGGTTRLLRIPGAAERGTVMGELENPNPDYA